MNETQMPTRIRPLTADDLKQVIDIDAYIDSRRTGEGRRRPAFFEKRLDAALNDPKYFIYIGYENNGVLQGYLQARLLEGEYGGTKPVAVLDNIGVEPESQGQGIGEALMQEFERLLKNKDIKEVHTQADWRNTDFIRFLSAKGFRLAPRHILERQVGYVDTVHSEDDQPPERESYEKDFSDPSGDQPGALARDKVYCRSLVREDLPALIRIDKKVTGNEHAAFYARKVKEVLDESGIRVSLVGELDGQVIGFIMARVDYGEFDRTEPTAVMDSIAVEPGYGHKQVGSALLSQLLGNLTTLRLETLRTEVDADHFDVLNFLMKNGFHPSQELAFIRKLD